jgi:RHS repeat-associated protein
MPAQGTDNNGNVAGMYYSDSANSGLSHTASYNYDGVNRLSGAAATGNSTYSQSYTYDPYGNMSCAASPAETKCMAPTYSPATSHITTSGYSYDAAGNLTGDGTNTYEWDAEARLAKVINGAGTAISTNTYNALGQRVRDVTTSNTTDEAYGADGALLWRYTGGDSNTRAFVPFNGRILAEYYRGSSPGLIFDHPDEIASLTASTLYNGSACQERLFYPFGELWTGAGNYGMHQEFAQLPDYDPETDQYNTLARHYNPTGRWLSPDPLGGHLEDPQTLNKYAYVRNNPTTSTDPTGLACIAGITIFGSHFGGRCKGDEPPPPPRRPPPPPTLQWEHGTAAGETVTITTTKVNYATLSGTVTTETRTGNHPFRDYNPGDIKSGRFAGTQGSIGTDKGIAIFPDARTGFGAGTSLLRTPGYQNETLDSAIARWAPPTENDTASYQAEARSNLGVSGDTKVSALSTGQIQQLANLISVVEGFNSQGTTSVQTLPILPPF